MDLRPPLSQKGISENWRAAMIQKKGREGKGESFISSEGEGNLKVSFYQLRERGDFPWLGKKAFSRQQNRGYKAWSYLFHNSSPIREGVQSPSGEFTHLERGRGTTSCQPPQNKERPAGGGSREQGCCHHPQSGQVG